MVERRAAGTAVEPTRTTWLYLLVHDLEGDALQARRRVLVPHALPRRRAARDARRRRRRRRCCRRRRPARARPSSALRTTGAESGASVSVASATAVAAEGLEVARPRLPLELLDLIARVASSATPARWTRSSNVSPAGSTPPGTGSRARRRVRRRHRRLRLEVAQVGDELGEFVELEHARRSASYLARTRRALRGDVVEAELRQRAPQLAVVDVARASRSYRRKASRTSSVTCRAKRPTPPAAARRSRGSRRRRPRSTTHSRRRSMPRATSASRHASARRRAGASVAALRVGGGAAAAAARSGSAAAAARPRRRRRAGISHVRSGARESSSARSSASALRADALVGVLDRPRLRDALGRRLVAASRAPRSARAGAPNSRRRARRARSAPRACSARRPSSSSSGCGMKSVRRWPERGTRGRDEPVRRDAALDERRDARLGAVAREEVAELVDVAPRVREKCARAAPAPRARRPCGRAPAGRRRGSG